MAKSKDLFDDTTMSFGEHLEVLRVHLWKAIIGLFICVIAALFFGDRIVAMIQRPINDALGEYNQQPLAASRGSIVLKLNRSELARALANANPKTPAPQLSTAEGVPAEGDKFRLRVFSPGLADVESRLEALEKRLNQTSTLTVQEPFSIYLKVSFVTGFVIASPWVFYQMWLFVAAGLYPHERRYVHLYFPISIVLFLAGVILCFFFVMPYVLSFLLGFNKMMNVAPNIRLTDWTNFAIMLPVMFGVSFQLPLVMLFLERISIFQVEDYRSKRRLAILVISIISMMLTPAEPISMMFMMVPLVVLYELGILMCDYTLTPSPFEAGTA